MHPIFLPTQLGPLTLQSRIVMSPMTRSRADADGAPTEITATYYEQRASAGLVITEGIAPSSNGKGYPRSLNMLEGAEVLAPSAVRLEGAQMWTDQKQMQDYPTPRAMTEAEVETALEEHVIAARNAIRAGFDGVELHGANGYLTADHSSLNPDLVTRFARSLPLATPDMSLAFTPGPKGYIDYPIADVG